MRQKRGVHGHRFGFDQGQESGSPVDRWAPESSSERDARRDEQAIELCDSLIDITSALFGVSSKEMRRAGRTNLDVARVRQVAMYVGHVVLRLNMREVAVGFARDRTTVLHACHLIEDLRDDLDFDRIVGMTERIALAAFGKRLEMI